MAQIGPDYTYNTDTTIAPATRRKLIILARKDPEQAAVVAQILGYGDSVPGLNISKTKDEALQKFDKYTRNQIQTLFAQELAISKNNDKTQTNTNANLKEIAGDISESVTSTLDNISKEINKTMEPVSTAVGSTLVSLTGMLKDPLGSITLLPQTLVDVVSKFNLEFAARLDATFKSEKMKNLANLPTQIMGNINQLITKIDEKLAVPIGYISDLYNGAMDLMNAMADLVDEMMSAVQKFIFGEGGLLDSIVPIDDLLSFLDALSEFAGEIGGISTTFLGSNPVAGFTNSLQSYTNQLGSFISNPTDLLASYLPVEVSQGLYVLRNPQQFVNSLLPSELTNLTAKISQITGFGFNGNMGYGLQSVLEGLKDGALRSILTNFANQYAILTPLLNSSTTNTLNASQPPTVTSSVVNSKVTVTKQGIPQPQTTPKKVVSEIDEATRKSDQEFLTNSFIQDTVTSSVFSGVTTSQIQAAGTTVTTPGAPEVVSSAIQQVNPGIYAGN